MNLGQQIGSGSIRVGRGLVLVASLIGLAWFVAADSHSQEAGADQAPAEESRPETAGALSGRLAELEAEAKAAVAGGDAESARALQRALVFGKLLMGFDSDNGGSPVPTKLADEMIAAEFPPVTFVKAGAEWRYFDVDQDPGVGWTDPEFDDSAWGSGPAPLGFGNGGEATVIKGGGTFAVTYYFRHRFDFQGKQPPQKANLVMKVDDGAVVYLNGSELLRHKMPEGIIQRDTRAAEVTGGEWESHWWAFQIEPTALRQGSNLLAVEVHQFHHPNGKRPSSDLSLDLELTHQITLQSYVAGITDATLREVIGQLTRTMPEELARECRQRWEGLLLREVRPESDELLLRRAEMMGHLGRGQAGLAAVDALLGKLPDPVPPEQVQRHRNLLRLKGVALEALGRKAEAEEVIERVVAIPPRKPGLSPEQVDLTEFYTGSLSAPRPFREGSEQYWMERIPELFDPAGGPEFDLRGLIQLDSGVYRKVPGKFNNKTVAAAYGVEFPKKVSIAIERRFRTVHFLQACREGMVEDGVEVARYVIHYQDDSKEVIPVVYGADTANFVIAGKAGEAVAGSAQLALKQEFADEQGNPSTLVLALQTWENPAPRQEVLYIEFVTREKKAAPFLVAITFE